MLKRSDYLQRLIANSVEATFVIPSSLFDETNHPNGRFEEMRRAYNILKKDSKLEILEVPINPGTDDEFLEITITIKPKGE